MKKRMKTIITVCSIYVDTSVTPNATRTYSNGNWRRVAYVLLLVYSQDLGTVVILCITPLQQKQDQQAVNT